jgi:hypothetical protein
MVEHDPFRNTKATMTPLGRQRQVDLAGQNIGQAVERQCSLVREHAPSLRPKPNNSQFLMVARREVDDSVDPAPRPGDATSVDVFQQQL